jgi:hypothetical protein
MAVDSALRPMVTRRMSMYKQILLLLAATAFVLGALGVFACARDGGSCERPPATSDAAPFTPLSLAHCPAHCLDGSTLLPAMHVMPGIIVTLTILGAAGALLVRETSVPPLTPPPRFVPASR